MNMMEGADNMTNVDYFEIDGKEYMITNEVNDNDIIYYFLSNLEEKDDIMVRKSNKNDLTTLYPLDDIEEVTHAIDLLEKIMIQDFAA